MKHFYVPVCILIFFGFFGFAKSTDAYAQSVYGDWGASAAMGFVEIGTSNGPGNTFSIACNQGNNMIEGSSISATIFNRPPPRKSNVKVILDGDIFDLFTDEHGTFNSNCRVCADQFREIIRKIGRSQYMLVQFSDGRSSKFSLRGASAALHRMKCSDGFYN